MLRLLFIAVSLAILLAACAPAAAGPVIQLSRLEPLPDNPSTEVLPLRVAVAAVISPEGTVESYGDLLDYLGQELGRPVELVQRRTYMEINDLIRTGKADLAFVCTSAYLVGRRDFNMQLLAAPQVDGEIVYNSLLVVPADSPAQSMADLEGKVFAFTDPISNTGRMYPTSLVLELGSRPEQFFSRTFYTYSHDDAIQAVAEGIADGAAVDSLVLDFALSRQPDLARRIRIIHTSPPFGMPPLVVGPTIRPQLRAELEDLLLAMHDSPQGKAALEATGIDRFVRIDDSAYDSAQALFDQVAPLLGDAP